MSRVLFAWELGANLGHLARDIPVAEKLRTKGHDVLFAVKDVGVAARMLTPRGFRFVQAPIGPLAQQKGAAPANYSEILMAIGYGDVLNLQGRVQAWGDLMKLHGSCVVVVNHAPTALLAARVFGLPAVITCVGFEIPPDQDPFPSIRPWESIPLDRLRSADERMLNCLNGVLTKHGKPTFQRISDLFSGVPTVFTTFAELDHYGARSDAEYVGIFSAVSEQGSQPWPAAGSKRVFAYLRPSVPGFENMLSALRDTGASVLCVAPGTTRDVAKRFQSSSLAIVARPLALESLLAEADLAVVYGTGTMADALLAGIPLLMVPQVVEQTLMARRIEALGAGKQWLPPRTLRSACELLESMTTNQTLRQKAAEFAKKYENFSRERAIHYVVETIRRCCADRP